MGHTDTSSSINTTTSSDRAQRDRLITKGRSVLELCIEQEKILCVQGFVDSQVERGGVYLEVVREMRDFISARLSEEKDRGRRKMLRELHTYVDGRLTEIRSVRVSRNGHHNGVQTPGGANGVASSLQKKSPGGPGK